MRPPLPAQPCQWGELWSVSADITSTPAGCSSVSGGTQPGVAIHFWSLLRKKKDSLDGKLRHLLCLLAAAWQLHNAMTAVQVLHRMLFFLPSQQADCSMYVLLMMLFPEALGMPEELEVQLSSPPNLFPFCSLGGDGARWRPPSHSSLEFLAAWWPASGNRRWATWRCYLRHLTHKWIKKH